MKNFVKNIPILGSILVWVARQSRKLIGPPRFPGTISYWEKRYVRGGDSGSGSYNRLAHFKAEVLNSIILDCNVASVIEFGCGDGNQLELANYPTYIGYDVSVEAVRRCKTRFTGDLSKEFKLVGDYSIEVKADLSLSLDVIFHLVEDSLFDDYMKMLFDSSNRYVIIYSSDSEDYPNHSHVKHRRFSSWILSNRSNWVLFRRIENRYPYDANMPDQTSFSDFFIYQKCATKIQS